MTTCSESGQVRKEAAIRSLCRASESIERTGFLFVRFYQTAQCSTLRATQSDNLSFKRQGMTRRSMPCLFHANLFALDVARWLRQDINGYVVQETAALPFVFTSKEARFPGFGWGNGPLCLWACRLVGAICSGSYFEFLMRRTPAVAIPNPAAAIPASVIALGAASPVFASLPAVVSACLVELDGAYLPVADELAGCAVSAGCAELEGFVVSAGFVRLC